MKRTTFEDDICPVARSIDAIGDGWSILILREAFLGKRRFGEFQKALGVAKNILTAKLRKLVALGVLEIVPASDGSAFGEYILTSQAKGLWIVLEALRQWGGQCFYEPGELETQLVDRRDRKPVKPLELRSHDGRVLGPADVIYVKKPVRKKRVVAK